VNTSEILDGRYRITRRVGIGGMGEVYHAERTRLGDDVAIKFMRSDANDGPRRERFMIEARAAAALRHPNIVSVIDFGIDDTRGPFLVMEYLNGPSLAQEIAESGPFEVQRAAAILADLASAIDLAHSIGLVHRDLKPANVVAHRYSDGDSLYKIVDFGIGIFVEPPDEATTVDTGPVLASLPYASPEQLLGERVDGRSDIYSLGATAFEMLTGRTPFALDDAKQAVARGLFGTPPRPSTIVPALGGHIDEAVLKALAKEPERRWPTARAFARALTGASSTRIEGATASTGSLHERYELGERIATGRLGSEIYDARHRAIGHPVVVRILRRTAGSGWAAGRARFLREARAMQVAHPSILQVRDFGEEPDLVYVVTDRVRGRSLREVLETEGRLPWHRGRRLMLDLLSAGQAVHRGGGLICGATSSIVRVCSDDDGERLVVSSAGIGEVRDVLASASEERLQALEISSSDLLYVAPEMLLGEEPDGRTDVYTVGVIAYEMLTGHLPFTAFTVPQLVVTIVEGAFADPRGLAPDLPESAANALARCLAYRPDRRFADMAELNSVLRDMA
jgi:serine/threonine-protein kinase